MSIKKEIDLVLKEEKRLLLNGDILNLGDLLKKKEMLINQIESNDIEFSRDEILYIRRLSVENEQLLGATEQGIKSALNKIEGMNSQKDSKTYTKSGNRTSLNLSKSSVREKI
ncbi:MAG: hypothetical protein AAF636_21690 [Pseudomonadota bacterium]